MFMTSNMIIYTHKHINIKHSYKFVLSEMGENKIMTHIFSVIGYWVILLDRMKLLV